MNDNQAIDIEQSPPTVNWFGLIGGMPWLGIQWGFGTAQAPENLAGAQVVLRINGAAYPVVVDALLGNITFLPSAAQTRFLGTQYNAYRLFVNGEWVRQGRFGVSEVLPP